MAEVVREERTKALVAATASVSFAVISDAARISRLRANVQAISLASPIRHATRERLLRYNTVRRGEMYRPPIREDAVNPAMTAPNSPWGDKSSNTLEEMRRMPMRG
jgi:hypothetical protein